MADGTMDAGEGYSSMVFYFFAFNICVNTCLLIFSDYKHMSEKTFIIKFPAILIYSKVLFL